MPALQESALAIPYTWGILKTSTSHTITAAHLDLHTVYETDSHVGGANWCYHVFNYFADFAFGGKRSCEDVSA